MHRRGVNNQLLLSNAIIFCCSVIVVKCYNSGIVTALTDQNWSEHCRNNSMIESCDCFSANASVYVSNLVMALKHSQKDAKQVKSFPILQTIIKVLPNSARVERLTENFPV